MYFLLGREIGNGFYDYVSDIERMALTDDPSRAQQVSEAELDMLDMDFLMNQGFYAMEIDRFGLRFSPVLLFRPPMMHYRPRFMPKRPGNMVVRPPRHMQPFSDAHPPRKPGAPRGQHAEDGRHGAERRTGPDEKPARMGGAPDGKPGGRFSSFAPKSGRGSGVSSGKSGGYRAKPGPSARPAGRDLHKGGGKRGRHA